MWPICSLTLSSLLWLLGPLLLGLLSAWWIWGGRRREIEDTYAAPEPAQFTTPPTGPLSAPAGGTTPTPVITPAAAPMAVPDPAPIAEPVRFTTPAAAPVDTGVAGAGVAGSVAAGAGALALTAIGIPAARGAADDLLLIKGIGPKLNDVLNGLGVTRFDQIANWSASDVDKVDDHLGAFKDRIGQEEWIPQARLLADGNHAEWSRIYDAGKTAMAGAAAGAVAMTAIGIPAAVGSPDDLSQIKGVGPKLNDLLIGLGVRRFDQVANWGAAEIGKVDEHLGAFKGRIDRDRWVEQASLLARGAIAEFEAKFGQLDSENQ
jgi:predicted flap endonuclease-1-like 5' DNA nuclease